MPTRTLDPCAGQSIVNIVDLPIPYLCQQRRKELGCRSGPIPGRSRGPVERPGWRWLALRRPRNPEPVWVSPVAAAAVVRELGPGAHGEFAVDPGGDCFDRFGAQEQLG